MKVLVIESDERTAASVGRGLKEAGFVVEAYICRPRTKIDRSFEEKLIHTVRGAGYVVQ